MSSYYIFFYEFKVYVVMAVGHILDGFKSRTFFTQLGLAIKLQVVSITVSPTGL